MTAYDRIAVTPIAGALGAEIGGVDLAAPLDDETYAEIRRALVERQVIFFRDQSITPERQIALTARFGAVSRVPYVEAMAEHPDIIAVLKEADEVGISTFGGTWHTDFSFLEAPPLGSVLYAHEVPEHGGDTLWASQYAAYESLSDGMKAVSKQATWTSSGRRAVIARMAAIRYGPASTRHMSRCPRA